MQYLKKLCTILLSFCASYSTGHEIPPKEKLFRYVKGFQNFVTHHCENYIENGINVYSTSCPKNEIDRHREQVRMLGDFINISIDQENLKGVCLQIDELCEPILHYFFANENYKCKLPTKQERAKGYMAILYSREGEELQLCKKITQCYIIFLKAILKAYNEVCLEDENF